MQATTDTVVAIDYHLTNTDGETLDSSEERGPLSYLHGHGNIVPGLEKAIEGKSEGDQLSVEIEPTEAYGEYREELVQNIPREAFSGVDKVEPGMRFSAESEQGPMVITVREVGDQEVTVDANHELAGQHLNFDVTVREVRAATDEEKASGEAG